MKMKEFHGEYLAPEVRVVEMKVRDRILNTSLDYINRKDSVWDEDYNICDYEKVNFYRLICLCVHGRRLRPRRRVLPGSWLCRRRASRQFRNA